MCAALPSPLRQCTLARLLRVRKEEGGPFTIVVALLAGCGSQGGASGTNPVDASSAPSTTDDGGVTDAASAPADDSPTAEGGTFGQPAPLMLAPPSRRRIAAGAEVTCATSDQSSVICWGDDSSSGQHVSGVALQGSFFNLAVGLDTAYGPVCGVASSGAVACAAWSNGGPPWPQVQDYSDCVAKTSGTDVALGGAAHDLVALVDPAGRVQIVSPGYCQSLPLPPGLPALRRLGVIASHACGLDPAGAAVCWQLFDDDGGAGALEPTPADHYVDIAESSVEACGVTAAGKLRCWDISGVEDTSPYGFVREVAKTSKRVVQLAGDGYGSQLCALLEDGTVTCSSDFAISPFDLGLTEAVVEIAVGASHVCGIRPDDTVVCVPAGCTGCVAAITPPAGFKAAPVR